MRNFTGYSLKKVAQFIVALLPCWGANAFAQNNHSQNEFGDGYRAVHWGLDEGLSQGETYNMIKDIDGFLWIGTKEGLNRFDGNTFKIYTHQRNDNRSLIANNVSDGLLEDSLHNIWIGSVKGLSRLNIKTEDFTNFPADTTLANDINDISPFWATKNEVLCIEHESTITSYNIHSSARKILAKFPRYHGFVGVSAAYSIFDSSANSVWCLVFDAAGATSLLKVSLSTGQTQYFPLPHPSKSAPPDAEGMCYDAARKCIWINGGYGLLQFTLSDKQYHHIGVLNKYEHLRDYSRFVGITLDKEGRIWFATDPKGIIIYNPAADSVSFPFPGDSVRQHNVSYANACIYLDRDNIIWSGYWLRKGIYAILPFSPIVKHYVEVPGNKNSLSDNFVVSVHAAGSNSMWTGTSKGLDILNNKTGTVRVLKAKDCPGLKADHDRLFVVKVDTILQKAWLYAAGFFVMDMVTKKCTPVVFKKFDGTIIPVDGIPKDGGKEIYFTLDDGKSQAVYILDTDSTVGHEVLQVGKLNIYFTTPVQNRLLFLCGNDERDNQTYARIKNKWVRTRTPVDSIAWTYLYFNESDLTYWVAGENRLFHFNKDFHIIRTYSKENGLPELPVVGLISDNNGNIWFHTDRSIHELNVLTGQINTMSETDGFEKQDFELLPFANKDADGNIYYGGGVFGIGFDKITPRTFGSNISTVYLRSLAINDRPFPLKESINYTDTISLNYSQTKIAIDAGIIDFYSKGKSRIRYTLERNGMHEDWQYTPYYYTIRLEGLAPGDYKLVMQASNASNLFNGAEKKIFIHVSPPFWQTWWFRIGVVVLGLALIYLIIQMRSRNLTRQNTALEEKVIHRTKELKRSFEDLRSAQAQLIQSEKMASLGELTAGIAHEIQNPLNFVNNFSEVNKELAEELEQEAAKGNMDEVKSIAKDIKDNEEKIAHHGKRAEAIVKGMLQHSRTSSGQKELSDLNALCDEYVRLAYHGLRAKDKSFNAKFHTDFDPTLPKINIVTQDIGRVVLNLINNAFYAVAEKKRTAGTHYEPLVIVQTKAVKAPAGGLAADRQPLGVLIRVKDNGNGIPQNIRDKIFQPFFTTKPTGQGTGLGLSLAYDIVKAHGGEIRMETIENEGTEFTIEMPII